jgi:hypothetical protein
LTARLSVPALSELAGILIVALPLVRVVAVEVYPPPVSNTVPDGVGLPLPPFTATVTVKGRDPVMLDADGVTVTVGVILFTVSVTTLLVAGEPTPLLTTTRSCRPLSAVVAALVIKMAEVVPVPSVKGTQADPDRNCH